ncbi:MULTISPECIES: beta-N-acetylhexosaminidase [Paraburkholderia]|jgi:beta-N-acetylhexosaminidase|uniref:beta-N-acetylhexosaminidase n=1 Tax=Paraburkholderia TaxID=1822464 RepID=UPI0006D49505|nr:MULTISPECIES: beta-N-acetylhexosaminidase [Paraburkholderia]ALP63514.1 beta-hexosaminidase [Paraburkholderia caribensis]AMV42014.1 beta-hexosaminidase [Paraburkholderia caribensis]AUT51234.1 beta-N-acetylhexosaminidase [Paraburkholderia caribensis]CAG9237182.1 Beta-hexosaminidase [Paraburkholderia caribensis]
MKLTPGPVMLDVVGKTLNADDERRLAHPMTGGVILFARHFESRAQLVALTDAIRNIRDDLLIAVDHEGGRVQRFRTDGFTVLPAMGKLGALWDDDVLRATKVTTAVGYVLASELRACGIDMSFTPVLDLNYGHSQVIGDRAFHRDPRVVTMLAKSLNHGLALAGMANCGKHFPGHGFASADSHVTVPVDERTLDEILGEDVTPYDWLGLSLASVLPGHVIYPKVDSKPAGFSRVWIQDILRTRLGFEGAIFSDDLSMEAARQGGTLTQAATAALEAGVDMVLICNQPDEAGKVLDALSFMPSEESRQRLERMRPRGDALSWTALLDEPQYRQAQALLREAFAR